jgi:hypothetical protein
VEQDWAQSGNHHQIIRQLQCLFVNIRILSSALARSLASSPDCIRKVRGSVGYKHPKPVARPELDAGGAIYLGKPSSMDKMGIARCPLFYRVLFLLWIQYMYIYIYIERERERGEN